MCSQHVPVHQQERVIRGQLGEPGLGSHTQINEGLQQIPEPRHRLPLHLLQLSKLLPLLLLKLRLHLPALLNLLLMLPLRFRKGCWLQKLCDELAKNKHVDTVCRQTDSCK
jgi:hypothetical protein